MQINHRNISRYGFTPERVTKDDALSIRIACDILAKNRARYRAAVPYWIGLYRSGLNLKSKVIVQNAKSYDSIVRKTMREAYGKDNKRK